MRRNRSGTKKNRLLLHTKIPAPGGSGNPALYKTDSQHLFELNKKPST